MCWVRYADTSVETTLLIFAVVVLVFVWGAVNLLLRALGARRSPPGRGGGARRGRERIAGGLVALAEGRYTARIARTRTRLARKRIAGVPALARGGLRRGGARRRRTCRVTAVARAAGRGGGVPENARFQLEQHRPEAALALLKPQVEKSTLPPAGWQLLAEAALRSGDAATAFAALPELARAQTMAPQALAALQTRTLAAVLAAAPDRNRLNELWSGLSKAQRNLDGAVTAYARRAAEIGQILAGMSALEGALRRQWSELLIVCYGELGPAEADARLRYAEGWIAQQPNSAGLALTLGRLCIQCRLWGKARGYLERGLEIEPSSALWEALGDCHAGRDDSPTAARCWRNALLAARGEPTQPLPQAPAATALSTRAAVVEERSEHGVPRLPGVARWVRARSARSL